MNFSGNLNFPMWESIDYYLENCSECHTDSYIYDEWDANLTHAPISDNDFVKLFNFWMLGVIMPVISIFGIIANAASIIVLLHPIMRSSTINIYLAGLSAFDGSLLLLSLLLYPPMNYCEFDYSPRSLWCRYFFYSSLATYPLSVIMQSCSVWTLTAITVDRFIAISWPLRSRDWCTCKRAYIVLAAIVSWSILYNLPAFFELKLVERISISSDPHDRNGSRTELSTFMELEQTDLRRKDSYKIIYRGYCYLIFMFLVPAGAMLVLNVFVTVSVRKAYRLRRAMSGREEKERRCTIMAVLVVVTFLICNSLAFVNNLIEIFASDSPSRTTSYRLSVSTGNVLVALNSATNFLIYCALGVRFRMMFCKIFCMLKCCPAVLITKSGLQDRSYHSLTVRYSVRAEDKYKISIDQRSQNGAGRRSSKLNSSKYGQNMLQLDPSFDDFTLALKNGRQQRFRSFDSAIFEGNV